MEMQIWSNVIVYYLAVFMFYKPYSVAKGMEQLSCITLHISFFFVVMKNDIGSITVIQVQANQLNPLTTQVLLTSPKKAPELHMLPTNRPRRTGSLALFFRKVRWSTAQKCHLFSV